MIMLKLESVKKKKDKNWVVQNEIYPRNCFE